MEFQPRCRRGQETNWRLDPVLVAGCILIEILLRLTVFRETKWGGEINAILGKETPIIDWCGWKGTTAPVTKTGGDMMEVLETLATNYTFSMERGADSRQSQYSGK